jgi:hypothetical protein
VRPEERRGERPALRIANCSGFFGDRLSAAREMIEGGPIDVLTGDWLAELTMYVLYKTRERDGGYARTFLRQMEEVLPLCLERGITVVANAGGLDPPGCAAAVRELARRQGVEVRVASVAGDDLSGRIPELRDKGEGFVNLDTGERWLEGADVVTANAYLGAAPIAAALAAGAQVVVTGRVTDASLVVGPGIDAFGWGPGDLDPLAGAVVAGHIIECGAQCTGGNYAFFDEVPGLDRCGFPLVELHGDGSAVVTKHPGTGGVVSVGTVTAQLLYEIGSPRYLSPDAVARFDTISLAQDGPDRVRVSGTRGEPPPPSLKVAANLAGGWRNSMTLVLSGGRIREKAAVAEAAIWAAVPGGRGAFSDTAVELVGDTGGEGAAFLRVAVRGEEQAVVGRGFSAAVVETTLASYPGTYFTAAPVGASEVARYWPTLVDAALVVPAVELDGAPVGPLEPWLAPPADPEESEGPGAVRDTGVGRTAAPARALHLVEVPLGVLVGARSGDKGGNANVGLWADTDEVFAWVNDELSVERLRGLLPEAADLPIDRYALSNLRAVNFVVHGILGWGVASNLQLDSQAKGLAERVRARSVRVPAALVTLGAVAARLDGWPRPIAGKVN